MNYYTNMQNVLDYIEGHIDDELSIDQLAEMAALSKFYFQRLFLKLVGVNVMQYVRLRRVARASEEIRDGRKITDIAFSYGFNNLETFSRTFKSVYNLTPTEYQKSDIMLAHFYKPDLSIKYHLVDMGVPFIAAGIMLEINLRQLKEDIKLAGILQKCTWEPAGQDNPGMAWTKLFTVTEAIKNQSSPNVHCGISFPSEDGEGFNYLAALKVDNYQDISNDFYRYTVPSGLYAVCTFSAESFFELTNEALDKAFSYFLHTWLPNSHYEMTDTFAVEYYDYRSLKDHPSKEQVLTAPENIVENPPEMEIMVLVKEKQDLEERK